MFSRETFFSTDPIKNIQIVWCYDWSGNLFAWFFLSNLIFLGFKSKSISLITHLGEAKKMCFKYSTHITFYVLGLPLSILSFPSQIIFELPISPKVTLPSFFFKVINFVLSLIVCLKHPLSLYHSSLLFCTCSVACINMVFYFLCSIGSWFLSMTVGISSFLFSWNHFNRTLLYVHDCCNNNVQFYNPIKEKMCQNPKFSQKFKILR